jgi:hypothetical protein
MRHHAPPVVYPVGHFVWGRVVFVTTALLSALGLLVWQIQGAYSVVWNAAWLGWLACLIGTAVWGPRQTLSHGELFWSGKAWFWQYRDPHCQFQAHQVLLEKGWDTGTGLLLWVKPMDTSDHGRSSLRAAWLCEAQLPSKWHGFRCAVYSRSKQEIHTPTADDVRA